MDDILADGYISEANLRLLVEKIYITEQDSMLNVDTHLKASFWTHGYTYEDGEITEAWSAWNYDYDRLGAILGKDFWEVDA